MNSSNLRGKIYSYKNFTFHDGGKANKLLVLVNEPIGNSEWIFVKTTSQPKIKESEGCHSYHNLFVINSKGDFFNEKTWVQFHELYHLDHNAILSAKFKGDFREIGKLKEQTIRAILNCIRKSPDLSPFELSLLQ